MIHKTIQKKTTIGKHHNYHEHSTITTSTMIRDQLIHITQQKAIGSEISAVDQGDRFVIHDIMKRMRFFAS
jgi:hypothetical protein